MPHLEIANLYHDPVLHPDHPECTSTRFGYEGGTVHREGGSTWVFTTENYGEPKNCAVRLSIWRSGDGHNVQRAGYVRDTQGTIGDPESFSCGWSPNVVFNKTDQRWYCFYVYYTHKGQDADPWNLFGRIGVSRAVVPGRHNVAGPWEDFGMLALTDNPQDWEGECGQVSWFPYQVGDRWYAFFASNSVGTELDAQSNPQAGQGDYRFTVGLAASSRMLGPFKRLSEGNPVGMDDRFVENPIVRTMPDGRWLCVFDGGTADQISYSWSEDGVSWQRAQRLNLPDDRPARLHEVRTPLGLVDNPDGSFDLYFTAFDGNNPSRVPPLWHDGFGCLWRARVEVVS